MTKPFTMANKFPFEKRINEMKRVAQQLMQRAPTLASDIALKEFKRNFQAQGLRVSEGQVQKWQPRQLKGSLPPRPILSKTGDLRDHMRSQPAPGMAKVVSPTPYARIHNRGGRMRGQMRAYSTNRKSGKTRLRPSGSPAHMPARPFMVTTPLLRQKIDQALHEEGDRLLNNKGL
mgnify:CR=1 FL=1